jgi:hypothetical protein
VPPGAFIHGLRTVVAIAAAAFLLAAGITALGVGRRRSEAHAGRLGGGG